MLTIADLKRPGTISGFQHVRKAGDGPKPFQAQHMPRSGDQGPRRASAAEAAQDFCDWYNKVGVARPRKTNKSAGHKRPKQRKPRKPAEVKHAEGMIRDWRAQQEGEQGYVYCFRETEGPERYVKIGYSTNPKKRIAEIQTGNPRVLEIVGFFEGTEEDERKLHARFSHSNKLQEWFRPAPALLSLFTKSAARSGGQPKEASTK